MYKITLFTVLLLLILVYIFLNLGRFVDITTEPKKADIIVSLGGDFSACRLKKALTLYQENFSESGEFIYTGDDYLNHNLTRKEFLLNSGIDKEKIIHISKDLISNTMEEVFFVKQYMLHHNYKNVLFVSHPQHSRRIVTLANLIAKYKDFGLELQVVSCNPSWWNQNSYYQNDISWKVTMNEMMKLAYNVMKYSPLLIDYTSYKVRDKELFWKEFLNFEVIENK